MALMYMKREVEQKFVTRYDFVALTLDNKAYILLIFPNNISIDFSVFV